MEEVEERNRYLIARDGDEEKIEVSVVEVHKLKIPKNDDGSIYQGSTTYNNGILIPQSYIPATQHHIDSFYSLKPRSCSNPHLLTPFSNIQFKSKPFLVTDSVYTLDHYFSTHFPYSTKNYSKPEWWQHISHPFMVLFRDVTEALLHIYHNNWNSCGNLTSNIYITEDGRARVLLSCDNSINRTQDVEDLIQVMKTVLQLPFQNDLTVFRVEDFALPSELLHFFSNVPQFISIMPPSFLVDHPCFWTVGERHDFVWKLVLLMSFGEGFDSALSHSLSKDKGFRNWADRLLKEEGVEEFDLEGENKVKQILAWEDVNIAKSLYKYYPQFYTTVFDSICIDVKEKRILDVGMLKEISSRYYHSK